MCPPLDNRTRFEEGGPVGVEGCDAAFAAPRCMNWGKARQYILHTICEKLELTFIVMSRLDIDLGVFEAMIANLNYVATVELVNIVQRGIIDG